MTENASEKLAATQLVEIRPGTGEVLKTQIDIEGDLYIHADQHGMQYGRGSVWLDNDSAKEFIAALDKFGVLKRFGYEKPKPPLPTGLGAVVRDKETGGRYASVQAGEGLNWWREGCGWVSSDSLTKLDYEILSEGVPA